MKIEAWITLAAVVRLGSIAAAARECNLTASAASIQIRKLESWMGQPLLDRSGHQVRPLPLAAEASDLMAQAMTRIESLRRPGGVSVEGTLRIGVIETLQAVLLPGVLARLRQAHPRMRILPRRGTSAELTQAVVAGELDGAAVGRPETGGSPRLAWHRLLTHPLVLIVPPDETDDDPQRLFRRHEWIRYDRRTVAGRLAARYLKDHVGERHPGLELDTVRGIVALVGAGLGVSVVHMVDPSLAAGSPVRVLPLPRAPRLEFSFVHRRVDAESRPLRLLHRLFTDAAKSFRTGDGGSGG